MFGINLSQLETSTFKLNRNLFALLICTVEVAFFFKGLFCIRIKHSTNKIMMRSNRFYWTLSEHSNSVISCPFLFKVQQYSLNQEILICHSL